jgi:predicted enzyme related to lactoylglutathione lyase
VAIEEDEYNESQEEGEMECLNGPVLAWAVLGVQDVAATSDYYREVLGFSIDFIFGSPPVHAGSSSNIHFARSKTIFCFIVPDIETLHENYLDSGAKIVAPPYINHDSGMREMDVEDCNGYILRFSQPIVTVDEEEDSCSSDSYACQ